MRNDLKFRTEIFPSPTNIKLEHNENILTIGSCFAENMAEYFSKLRFNISANPFGVLYNPVSILNSLKIVAEEKEFTKSDLVFHQSEWHSFYHHSNFSSNSPEEILTKINSRTNETKQFLQTTDWVLITFGTAHIYKFIETGITVSNCHKIPSKKFEHIRLSVSEIEESIKKIISTVLSVNPNARIIFTVSPVRHWKDGANENQLSKASLLLAINSVIKENGKHFYFPSYELLMDDLRDYRFYDSDLLHPNKIATEYIWEKFRKTFCSDNCITAINEIGKIINARAHRVRNPSSAEHQKFVKSMLEQLMKFSQKYPYLDFENDINYFSSQIIE